MDSKITFADMSNPFQRIVRFVLTDFKPNANNEQVPEEEADNIIRSAIFSPVKIFFTQNGPKGHAFAEPIGVVTSARREEDRIVAEARIWETENRDVIDWIAERYAANEPITVSWELMYDEKQSFLQNGVRILRDIVMTGVTIVANAAYGLRTSVLSFAETQGASMEETKELEELRAFRNEVIQKLEKARVFAERREKLPSVSEKHFDFIVGLSDEQFEMLLQFLSDMPSRQAAVSEVEAERVNIPNFSVASISPLELAKYLGSMKL